MKRLIDKEGIVKLVKKIRSASTDSIIRTTFIVGFPGETEEHFGELYDFVAENELDRMGVFTYSPEDGTPAEKFDRPVSERIKHDRMDRLMNLQREIAFSKNNRMLNKILRVLVDEVDETGAAIGRTYADCPEIDQEIIINDTAALPGNFYNVKIDRVDGYDLCGSIVRG